MTSQPRPLVFISHKHGDINIHFMDMLKHRLEQEGFSAWIDTNDMRGGDEWRRTIDIAIEQSIALIVIMSPEARSSEYITYEWSYSLGLKKLVIPILFRQTTLHPKLETLQYIDFTDDKYPKPEAWNALISRLQDTLREQVELFAANLTNETIVDQKKRYFDALDDLYDRKSSRVELQDIFRVLAKVGVISVEHLAALLDKDTENRRDATKILFDL